MYEAYYPYPWQPYMGYAAPQQRQGIQGVRFVDGIADVQSCSVPIGTKALFMDKNEDVFYIKDADLSGVSTVDAYEFRKRQSQEYVTREEFEKWRAQHEPTVQQPATPAQPSGATAAIHSDDQPGAGQAAGAAAGQGTWNQSSGMGRDSAARF